MSSLPFWALKVSVVLLSMEGQRALGFNQKYLNLCLEDEWRYYGFGTTWGWGWTIALNESIDESLCDVPKLNFYFVGLSWKHEFLCVSNNSFFPMKLQNACKMTLRAALEIINVFIYSYSETADTKSMLDSETQDKTGLLFYTQTSRTGRLHI